MTVQPAPLYTEIMHHSPGGEACWAKCADGVRIRLAAWKHGQAGTVVLFNGRTEYIEKFGEAAWEFGKRDLSFATFDWRRQGLSDDLGASPGLCHVDSFDEYLEDVAAVMPVLEELAMPQPWFLLAHSMGCAIALQALQTGLPVHAAAFCAPMWGLRLSPVPRIVAETMTLAQVSLGRSRKPVAGASAKNHIEIFSFRNNRLTSDAERYQFMRRQLELRPELAKGGPSNGWLHAALRECRFLAELPPPGIPSLVLLGAEEQIIDLKAAEQNCAKWGWPQPIIMDGARHELLMEAAHTRTEVFDRISAFFAGHS